MRITPRPGLEIVKRNIADRSPIEGVTYQVRQIDGDFLDTVETDSSGKAFLEVDPGSYEISEVNVPSNVIISEIPQTIFLEPGVTRTVRFFNAVKPSLTVIKRNSITKDPLENAKFHIYYASDNTETGEINDLGTYYTDSSGRIVLTNVNRGWYKVVEEESPTGFSIQDDGVYEFYLEAGASAVSWSWTTRLSVRLLSTNTIVRRSCRWRAHDSSCVTSAARPPAQRGRSLANM